MRPQPALIADRPVYRKSDLTAVLDADPIYPVALARLRAAARWHRAVAVAMRLTGCDEATGAELASELLAEGLL
jgi:hypothetical protein